MSEMGAGVDQAHEGKGSELLEVRGLTKIFGALKACDAIDLTDPAARASAAPAHKIGFDGCGVTHGVCDYEQLKCGVNRTAHLAY